MRLLVYTTKFKSTAGESRFHDFAKRKDEIRSEVQGEAPRQAPRVPSRILQEGERPNKVKVARSKKSDKL